MSNHTPEPKSIYDSLESDDYKNNQALILEMTKELKSHFLLDKEFVDPDKDFLPLLEKIIVSNTK